MKDKVKKETSPGLHFSKAYVKFSAFFLLGVYLLVLFLYWRKGTYVQPMKKDIPQAEILE